MIYVDDFFAPYGRMKMCHLLADTDEELHAMADRIGVARRHFQVTVSGQHYDVCAAKRQLAIAAGAVQVTVRQAAMMARQRRLTGSLGVPDPYYGLSYDPSIPR